MENDVNIFQRIIDTFLNPKTKSSTVFRVLGAVFLIGGIFGEAIGLGAVREGLEWVAIAIGIFFLLLSVTLELLKKDRQAAIIVFITGLIIPVVVAAVILTGPSEPNGSPVISPTPATATFTPTTPPTATPRPTNTATATAVPTTAPTVTSTPRATATIPPSPTNTRPPTHTPIPPPPTATSILHEVVSGDILTCVSLHYYWTHVRWNEICRENNLHLNPNGNCGPLNVGDILIIPPTFVPDDWFWQMNSPSSLDATCPIYPLPGGILPSPTAAATIAPTATSTATATLTPSATAAPPTNTAVPTATITPPPTTQS